MPTRDIRSNLEGQIAFNEVIITDTTTSGTIIDTDDYDSGIVFFIFAGEYNDGTFTPAIYESDDPGMSGATALADKNLIGTEAGATISGATTTTEVLKSLGVVGTKRYIQLRMVSTATTLGSVIVSVVAKKGELLPITGLSA